MSQTQKRSEGNCAPMVYMKMLLTENGGNFVAFHLLSLFLHYHVLIILSGCNKTLALKLSLRKIKVSLSILKSTRLKSLTFFKIPFDSLRTHKESFEYFTELKKIASYEFHKVNLMSCSQSNFCRHISQHM